MKIISFLNLNVKFYKATMHRAKIFIHLKFKSVLKRVIFFTDISLNPFIQLSKAITGRKILSFFKYKMLQCAGAALKYQYIPNLNLFSQKKKKKKKSDFSLKNS